MSYSFVVDIKEGKAIISGDAPVLNGVPDGRIQVNGHVPSPDGKDYQYESISVTRYDSDGNQVSQATALNKK